MNRVHHTVPPTPDTLSIQITGPYFSSGSLPSVLSPELIQHTNYVNNSTGTSDHFQCTTRLASRLGFRQAGSLPFHMYVYDKKSRFFLCFS